MAIKTNVVFDEVPITSTNDKVVKGLWVFNGKNEPTGERFKARLVAKGFLQNEAVETRLYTERYLSDLSDIYGI